MRVLIFLFVVFPWIAQAQLVGKVVSIADGDTFTMLVDNKQYKIRFHGIDCPEKNQDYGQIAKQFLSVLIAGEVVTVEQMDIDRVRPLYRNGLYKRYKR